MLDTIESGKRGRRTLTGEGRGNATGLFFVLVDRLAGNEFVLLVDDDDVRPGIWGLYGETICLDEFDMELPSCATRGGG